MSDGREERLRGAQWGTVHAEILRNVLAATSPSAPESVWNTVLTLDLGYALGGPLAATYIPMSIVAPGLVLLDEAELEPMPGPFEVRPLARGRGIEVSPDAKRGARKGSVPGRGRASDMP